MKASQKRLQELKTKIPEVSPVEAYRLQQDGAVLIDVREQDEFAQGVPAGAKRLGRGFLELKIEDVVPDPDTPLLVMCAGGVRSLFAAESLLELGYRRVSSMIGGFSGWRRAGLPVDTPRLLTKLWSEVVKTVS